MLDVTHAMSGRRKNNRGRKPDLSSQEFADGISFNPSTVDTITIADLLNVVNSTHKGILSKDVLKTFGEEKPKEGYYTSRALFSVNVPSQAERAVQNERRDFPTFRGSSAKGGAREISSDDTVPQAGAESKGN